MMTADEQTLVDLLIECVRRSLSFEQAFAAGEAQMRAERASATDLEVAAAGCRALIRAEAEQAEAARREWQFIVEAGMEDEFF
jgi:hypothetical protein